MNEYKKKMDRILVLTWISLVLLYLGYFVASLLNAKGILILLSGGCVLILAILFFFKFNSPIFPFIISFCSGISVFNRYPNFTLDMTTISIILGYGLLLLIINFAVKFVKYKIPFLAFILVFLLGIAIFNIVDNTLYSQLNLILSIYIVPIISMMLFYTIKHEEDVPITYGYFSSFIILFFLCLFV